VTDNTEEAKQFVEYWLTDGYIPWLAVAPEGKFPMRRGTQDEPTRYLEEWAQLEVGVDRTAPLSDFYSAEVIDSLIAGTNNFARWGFTQGQGDLVTVVYSTLIVPQTLDEVLAGSLSAEEGGEEMQLLVEDEQTLLEEEAAEG
jgi:multiple sugar transport system substrate-binding protein